MLLPSTTVTPSAPPASARLRLRDATRAAHDAAEDTPAMRALFDGSIDRARYEALIAALHGYFAAWESGSAAFLADAAAVGWTYTSRADLLARDRAGAAAPSVHATPALAHAQGWGMLYVIEGSTLGARGIAKQLRRVLPDVAPRYFALGADDPAHWRRFERLLERELADPATHAAAIVGAEHVFTELTAAMATA